MVSMIQFRQGLIAQMHRAAIDGRLNILINSRELYQALGGYPGSTRGMPSCCDAMQDEMKGGDILLVERTNAYGMTVRYKLPRSMQN